MTEHEQNGHLDKLLDSALSAYSAVEPGPGLETRILANLREAESREASRPWNFKWMWAGAAVAAILVLALWMGRNHRTVQVKNVAHTQPSPAPTRQAQQSTGAVSPQATKHRTQSHIPSRRQNAELAVDRRPPIFPTPVPLSEQERLMFAYLANTPKQEVIAQLQTNDENDEKDVQAFWEAQPFTVHRRSGNTQ
jgi:hypothetical protein